MRMKTLLFAGAALVALGGLAGAEPIKVWHHGGRGDGERESIAASIDKWNAMHPDMQAELVLLPEGCTTSRSRRRRLRATSPTFSISMGRTTRTTPGRATSLRLTTSSRKRRSTTRSPR